nr:hypothetical protein CFP56_29842 [Quercus suber]
MSTSTDKPAKFPWTQPDGNSSLYQLHCHCGTVRYSMKLSPPLYVEETTEVKPGRYEAVECACSHCERHGLWMVYPFAKDVHFADGLEPGRWERGAEERREYRSGAKTNPHFFCTNCGCVLGTDLSSLMKNVLKVPAGEERMSINIRMLKDFDRKKIQIRREEAMSSFGPRYSVDV